jgi:hypothetical protein
MRAWFRDPPVDAVVVGPLPDGVLLPEECACCGRPSTHQRALSRAQRTVLLVGYCDDCALHLSASETRQLASALASLVLSLSAAAALPLLFPALARSGLLLSVALISLLPAVLVLAPRKGPSAPHTARALAVQAGQNGRLVCLNVRYAERLAGLNALGAGHTRTREPRLSAWQSAGPLLGLGAALLFHAIHHPSLRVLNLTDARLDVFVDGSRVASIEPTSQESPAAGALVHAPAGHHQLSAVTAEGVVVSSLAVDLESGHLHLFAPGSDGFCFWLETLGYGRERSAEPAYRALTGDDRFWVLPEGIDLWFSPALPAQSSPLQSSGGFITALRQAPCSQAPIHAE